MSNTKLEGFYVPYRLLEKNIYTEKINNGTMVEVLIKKKNMNGYTKVTPEVVKTENTIGLHLYNIENNKLDRRLTFRLTKNNYDLWVPHFRKNISLLQYTSEVSTCIIKKLIEDFGIGIISNYDMSEKTMDAICKDLKLLDSIRSYIVDNKVFDCGKTFKVLNDPFIFNSMKIMNNNGMIIERISKDIQTSFDYIRMINDITVLCDGSDKSNDQTMFIKLAVYLNMCVNSDIKKYKDRNEAIISRITFNIYDWNHNEKQFVESIFGRHINTIAKRLLDLPNYNDDSLFTSALEEVMSVNCKSEYKSRTHSINDLKYIMPTLTMCLRKVNMCTESIVIPFVYTSHRGKTKSFAVYVSRDNALQYMEMIKNYSRRYHVTVGDDTISRIGLFMAISTQKHLHINEL